MATAPSIARTPRRRVISPLPLAGRNRGRASKGRSAAVATVDPALLRYPAARWSALYADDPPLRLSPATGERVDCASPRRLQRILARKFRLFTELLLDPDELVVFRGAVGAGKRAGLDLPAVRRHREVGDGRVLGLARAVRHHYGVAGAVRHIDGREGLGQGADLVHLHQDRVRNPFPDAFAQALDVSD